MKKTVQPEKKSKAEKGDKECYASCEALNRLNEDLFRLNQKYVDSEQMKSHFISNISNEMLNPFTSIIGLSKNILEVKRENWKKVIAMVALIHTEAFNLDFQLKNIFAAARIEAGEIFPEISDIDIKALVLDVVDCFKYEARKKLVQVNCRFTTDLPRESYYFLSDSEKIRLIFSNLLSNAIKFSYEKGIIKAGISLKNNSLTLVVHDFGEGISSSNQQIIFDRFKRIDSGISSEFRGHGLGLSINKAFLDMLEGTIKVHTSPEKGAKFTVKIPRSEGQSEGVTLGGNELLFKEDLF
jgi:two-component system, OmpR family, phosphate regulon sensor histidine kinase PhoR